MTNPNGRFGIHGGQTIQTLILLTMAVSDSSAARRQAGASTPLKRPRPSTQVVSAFFTA